MYTKIFRKTKDFLIPGIDYHSRIWHNFLEFWVTMLSNFVLVWLYNYFDLSVTDESLTGVTHQRKAPTYAGRGEKSCTLPIR